MQASFHGIPCWYELTTPEPEAAGAFYAGVLGWEMVDAGVEGFDYHVAKAGPAMVAGMSKPMMPGIPPHWLIYFAVSDCDATAAAIVADGGQQVVAPMDIPNTGRFAILTDPQGARFGILQPNDAEGSGLDPTKPGHGSWHELMSSDPVAGFAFYAKHFGWEAGDRMPIGEGGDYQLFRRNGADLGGMMGLPMPQMPPVWLPYFNVSGIDAAMAAISAQGGAVTHGPMEVPGGGWIIHGTDPQGAYFALTGPR